MPIRSARNRLAALTLLLILLCAAGGLALEAGAARRDITPETGLPMAGFAGRVAQGVLDSLQVRALALRSGGRGLVLICYDLLYPFGRPVNDALRDSIRARTGAQMVFFSATHTHSGPAIASGPELPGGHGLDGLRPHERLICRRTVEAAQAAWEALEPVSAGWGLGSADLTYNRIQPLTGGGVQMVWANHEKRPLGPVDQTVGVVRLDRLRDGSPLAVLVNYACHPVIFGKPGTDPLYSADLPGVCCRRVEEGLPGRPLCIYFNGAPGDLNPYLAHSTTDPRRSLEEAGRVLAAEVLRLAGEIHPQDADSSPALSYALKYFPGPGRWEAAPWKAHLPEGAATNVDSLAAAWRSPQFPLAAAIITPQIAFVGLPGEFFSAFQPRLRGSAGVPFVLVAGYTEGSFGYFPTLEAAVRGGYGANDQGTRVAAGSGERLCLEALISLHELRGALRPWPADPARDYRY